MKSVSKQTCSVNPYYMMHSLHFWSDRSEIPSCEVPQDYNFNIWNLVTSSLKISHKAGWKSVYTTRLRHLVDLREFMLYSKLSSDRNFFFSPLILWKHCLLTLRIKTGPWLWTPWLVSILLKNLSKKFVAYLLCQSCLGKLIKKALHLHMLSSET